MTDTNDAEIIKHLHHRVDRAPSTGFLTVETEHMRIVFRRLRDLEVQLRQAEPVTQSSADGLMAALNLQTINAAPDLG